MHYALPPSYFHDIPNKNQPQKYFYKLFYFLISFSDKRLDKQKKT